MAAIPPPQKPPIHYGFGIEIMLDRMTMIGNRVMYTAFLLPGAIRAAHGMSDGALSREVCRNPTNGYQGFEEGMTAFGILSAPARRSFAEHMSEPAHSPLDAEERDPVVATYRELFDLLRYIAARKFGVPPPDDETIVQEVFVTYLRRRSQVHDERKWLVSAVCNASRVYLRSATKHAALHDTRASAVAPVDVTSRIDARTVLRRLPQRCREMLRLRFYDGYSGPELAVHFRTTPRYAKLMLHRCMTAARALVRRARP